ncbi:hypothetical protein [Microvirga zambiensis]|uniref:hypothetical protein n=1 Tax=Microvirga zambiensis TaxID=1402137 RepID=UPI00191E96C1|nr:hypothetical protein [Microvirga zambiensis]
MDISLSSQARSEAAKPAGESSAGGIRIASGASAALEEAVKSAKLGLKPASSPHVAAEEPIATRKRTFPIGLLSQAAVALVLVGAGWSASYMGTLANKDVIRQLEAETARSQEILERLSTELGALRQTVVAYKDVEHTSSTASASEQTKLTDKVERLTISLQEPDKKLTALEGRLDRMETQILTTIAGLNTKLTAPAAAAAPSPAAPAPTEAALREEAPAPKPAKSEPTKSEPVDGWVLREVYNGAALVENRNRRLYEVMPGGMLPGVGRIEGIERRGARWVVVTDKGFIGTYR